MASTGLRGRNLRASGEAVEKECSHLFERRASSIDSAPPPAVSQINDFVLKELPLCGVALKLQLWIVPIPYQHLPLQRCPGRYST